MTTKGNIEWEYWRKHNDTDAGGRAYVPALKLYQPPKGHTGGPWPQDIRAYYAVQEKEVNDALSV